MHTARRSIPNTLRSKKMKILTVEQKRTQKERKECKRNNRNRSHSDHKRKQLRETVENHSNENVTSPYKESTKENTQKTETTKPS